MIIMVCNESVLFLPPTPYLLPPTVMSCAVNLNHPKKILTAGTTKLLPGPPIGKQKAIALLDRVLLPYTVPRVLMRKILELLRKSRVHPIPLVRLRIPT